MLAVAPDPALPLAAQPRVTACWNSALGVLAFLTGDDGGADLPRIVEVLAAASTEDLLDDTYAFWALEVRLIDADPPACERVGAWLAATSADPQLPAGCGSRRSARAATTGTRRGSGSSTRSPGSCTTPRSGWPSRPPGCSPTLAVPRTNGFGGRLRDGRTMRRTRRTRSGGSSPRPTTSPGRGEVLAGAGDGAAVTAALEILGEHGEATDLPALLALVTGAADGVGDRVAADRVAADGVAAGGFAAAVEHCLRGADDALVLWVAERLAAVFTDERVPGEVRVLAIRPLWSGARPWSQADALAGLLDHGDVRLSDRGGLRAHRPPGRPRA